jgi:hypothetical protein
MEPEGSLYWTRPIQSTPHHPISTRSILILSTQLRPDLPSGLFPYGFPGYQSPIRVSLPPTPISATCPAHLILLGLIILIIIGEEYKSPGSSLCSFLHPERQNNVTKTFIVYNMYVDDNAISYLQNGRPFANLAMCHSCDEHSDWFKLTLVSLVICFPNHNTCYRSV